MAVFGSGKMSMSLSLIGWNPLMLDPSNPIPFSNRSSSTSLAGIEKCWSLPNRSVNFRSTNSISSSANLLIMSFAPLSAIVPPFVFFSVL